MRTAPTHQNPSRLPPEVLAACLLPGLGRRSFLSFLPNLLDPSHRPTSAFSSDFSLPRSCIVLLQHHSVASLTAHRRPHRIKPIFNSKQHAANMRYLDWDLLLFPSGEGVEGAHVPFVSPPTLRCLSATAGHQNRMQADRASLVQKEFKTQCQVEGKHIPEATPLMSAFVPSLPAGNPFQISVHSWSPTAVGHIVPVMEGHVQPRELFEVRVLVDGKLNAIAHLPVDSQWPQIISEFCPS